MTADLAWLRGLLVPERRGDLEERLVEEVAARHAAEGRMVDKMRALERRLLTVEQYLADVNRKRIR